MFLVFPLLASCAANDGANFESYTFTGHVSWNLTCPFAKRAFVFLEQTAENVTVYDGLSSHTLEKPYALGTTMNVTLEFDAEEPTGLIRILTAVTDCFNGAYLMGGGDSVDIQIKSNATDHTETHFCMFSPLGDTQPVNVQYRMTEYRRFWEKATIYWQDGQGTASEPCESNETCTMSLPNSMYYVSYYKADAFNGGIKFHRENATEMTSYPTFYDCTYGLIPYLPPMQIRSPYNVEDLSAMCSRHGYANLSYW